MLTTTMTEQELHDEITKDYPNVLRIADAKQREVDKRVRRSALFPVHFHSMVTTTRRNKWIIQWEALNKHSVGDDILISFVAYVETSAGRVAYMPSLINGKLMVMIFQPHVFRRFAERMNIALTGVDLMRRYFEKNNGYYYTFVDRPTAFKNAVRREVHGSCTEGVCMGLMSQRGDTIFLRTVVSHDMLKGSQVETCAATEKMRKEIYEEMIEEGLKETKNQRNK